MVKSELFRRWAETVVWDVPISKGFSYFRDNKNAIKA